MIYQIFQKREPLKPFYIGACFVIDEEVKIYIFKDRTQAAPITELLIEPKIEDENIQLLTIKLKNISDTSDTSEISDIAGENYLLKTNIVEIVRNYLGGNLNPDDIELRD